LVNATPWFIGFAEGDSSIVTFGGRPRFVLTQKEKVILDHIQFILDFGIVKKFQSGNTVYYRYIVQDLIGVLLLCLLFNRNLCLQHCILQLSRWIIDINVKLSSSTSQIFELCPLLSLIEKPIMPTLNDS
jgi:hypothetical protein